VRRLCVFCGSSSGRSPAHAEAARQLGARLAAEGIGLVYGGGASGMMGVLADAVLSRGGQVTGVIPVTLSERELAHPRVADMRVVPDMHSRKALMAELAEAIMALPGGFGTFDELLETLTWAQLGLHQRRIGLANVEDYFGPFLRMIDHAVVEGFVTPADRRLIVTHPDPVVLLRALMPLECASQGTGVLP
jgi:uncharacterized protein (TIGR00730 family)